MRSSWYAAAAAGLLSATMLSSAQDQQPGPPSPEANAPAARPPVRPRLPAGRPSARRFLSQVGWRPSIRGPLFAYPPGYGHRRWRTGEFLPPVFLASPYYYDDYAALELARPPLGYRWIRYGPDLLLVDVNSGRIGDVVDGVFY